jgi:single-strand DNA-binding protein
MGRLARDPDVRYSQGENPTAVARYNIAVDRRFKKPGEADADFISCVSFGKTAEFAEKYFRQGTKIAITGRIQTGSYTNKDGQKVYTTDVVIEEQEFAENKSSRDNTNSRPEPSSASDDGFMNIPEGLDEELPFQ